MTDSIQNSWRKVGDGLPIVGECVWQAKSGSRFYGWYKDGFFYEGHPVDKRQKYRKKYTLNVVLCYLPITPPEESELCKHGKGINDYCEPCERIHGG